MKQYRFKAWAAGKEITSTVSADNDDDAINGFCKNLNEGNCKIEVNTFVNFSDGRYFVTYEEM